MERADLDIEMGTPQGGCYPRLLKLLRQLDNSHQPPLSSRVEIDKYARKLSEHAVVLFVRHGTQDVGTLAIYCNDATHGIAYISAIAVLDGYRGMGLGQALLEESFSVAQQAGMAHVRLEVHRTNAQAVRLYTKCGFRVYAPADVDPQDASIFMHRDL